MMMKTGLIAFSLLSATVSAVASGQPQASAAVFDASRLKTGVFTYRDIQDGKPGALATCSVAALDAGRYRFTCDFPAFEQSWDTVATRAMAPVQTTLKMRTRDGRHYQMDLSYAGAHVTGEAVTSGSADGKLPGSDQAVTADVPADTVDQRIDWATVMAADVRPGQDFTFGVYDAKTGVSRVDCSVSDAGMMQTAVGPVRAIRLRYTVYKASGTETYTVYTSSSFPRIMLREDLPGGLSSELVKAGD